ncbi:hypothetical protein MT418_006553 [Batrachochytrium dendrobatidis]
MDWYNGFGIKPDLDQWISLDTLLQVIGEGNANVIVAICNPPRNSKTVVLRLAKESGINLKPLPFSVADQQAYQICATLSLFGQPFLPEMSLVSTTPALLSKIAASIMSQRNSIRTYKNIDILQKSVMIMENTMIGSNDGRSRSFAIEIKPKWGFRPPEANGQLCRFCMHQIIKSKQDGSNISKYCPLLLFSRNKDSIKTAIQSLLQTPQNNLKLFDNGMSVEFDEYYSTLKKCFGSSDAFIELIAQTLFDSSLLESLKDYQSAFHASPATVQDIIRQLSDDDKCTIDALLIEHCNEILKPTRNIPSCSITSIPFIFPSPIGETPNSKLNQLTTNQMRLIFRFLISMTLKDASIVLVFEANNSDGTMEFDRMRLIDLDPKSIHSISKWLKLQKEIDEVSNHIKEGRSCFGASRIDDTQRISN